MRTLVVVILIYFLTACYSETDLRVNSAESSMKVGKRSVIHLIFFDDYKHDRLGYEKLLKHQVKKYFKADLVLEKSRPLPAYAYYKPRGRYRADSLLKFLHRDYKIIGVTAKDISVTKGGHQDWGIMGLARSPGNPCVVSLYRTKNIKRLIKTSLHEIAHTYGLKHCEEDTCWMHTGDVPMSEHDRQVDFCGECKKKLAELI